MAVTEGAIAETGTDGSEGNYLYFYDRGRDRTYVYVHMIEPATVSSGEEVKAGQRLAAMGRTGAWWDDHLHFEIRDGRGIGGSAHAPRTARLEAARARTFGGLSVPDSVPWRGIRDVH